MRKNLPLVAALFVAALAATPLVMSGTKALAVSEESAGTSLPAAILPVEVAPVAPPVLANETCSRKVRVVYSGYGTPGAACTPR